MRINPIMAKSQYLTTQKINFGMIDNKKTEELTRQMMEKEYEGYFEEDEIGGEEYNDAMKYMSDAMQYLKTSPLFTVRSKKDIDNEDVLYVTMNKEEVDKHKHKELFNKMIENCKKFYDEEANSDDEYIAQSIKEKGVLEEEGFLEVWGYYGDIESFYTDFQEAEQGIVAQKKKEPKPEPTINENYEKDYDPLANDSSYQAWILYKN